MDIVSSKKRDSGWILVVDNCSSYSGLRYITVINRDPITVKHKLDIIISNIPCLVIILYIEIPNWITIYNKLKLNIIYPGHLLYDITFNEIIIRI